MNDQNAYTENKAPGAENAEANVNTDANTNAENTAAQNAGFEKENRNPYSAGYTGSYQNNQGSYQEAKTTYQGSYTSQGFDAVPEQRESNTLSVLSLILGILSIAAICCCGSSLLFGAAAIVLALVRRKKRGSMDGMAIAGLVMGIIGAFCGLLAVIFMLSSFTGAVSGVGDLADFFDMEYYLY